MTHDEPLDEGGVATSRASALSVATSGVARNGVDWDAVRHDFLYSGMAQRRIAWKYGTSDAKLRERREAEGWERVMPCVPLPTRRVIPREGEPPTPTQQKRSRLTKRLYAVLEAKLIELEMRMAVRTEAPDSAADAERDIRTMTGLMQFYTKLVAMDDAARAANKNADKNTNENADMNGARTDDDADRLRRDLAERLARLSAGDT